MSVTLLLLAASVAIVAASSATRVNVSANQHVTIAVVDENRTTPERAQFRADLAAALETVVTDSCGDDVQVRSAVVEPQDAKLRLNGGDFDAALVIGNDRPRALRRLDLVTLAGTLVLENGPQPVYLIMADGDPLLTDSLKSAFAKLLARQDDGRESPLPNLRSGGTKYAAVH